MEQLPQWSQEGYEGEQRDRRTRQPRRQPGVKSIRYLDDILIYSKDPTGRSLSYMDDTLPYNPTESDSSKKLNLDLWSPDLWKNLEDMMPHAVG